MNLKDFSFIKEDDANYHIKHPKGPVLVVSKKGLTPKAHSAIQKFCSGGNVQNFDDGGTAQDTSQAQDFVPGQSDYPLVTSESTPDVNPMLRLHGELAPSPATVLASSNPSQSAVDLASSDQTASAPNPANAAPGFSQPQPASQIDPMIQGKLDTEGLLNKEQSDIQNAAKGEQGAEGAKAKAYGDFADYVGHLPTPQQIADSYKAKDDALFQNVQNGTIDPNRYLNNMSTGSRIAASIGILLSGLGAGANGKNLALEVINNSIDRDIDAQKNEQGKNLSLYKMNREALQSDQEANLATKNQMLTIAQAKVSQAGAQAQSADAKLRANQAWNQIEGQKIQNRQMLGILKQTSGNGFSTIDPAQLVSTLVPKEQQTKVFKEIGDAQNVAQNYDKMLSLYDQADKQNTILKTGAGLLRTPPAIKDLQALEDPLIHDEVGRVNEFEKADLNALHPMPGDLPSTVASKKQAFKDFMLRKGSAPTAKGFNLDLNRFASTSVDPKSRFSPQQGAIYNEALQRLRSNPQDPYGQAALKKLGVGG